MLFSSYSLHLSCMYVVFIIQLLLSKDLFHQSRFYLNNVHFHHSASTLERTISSIQVLFKQLSFSASSFYFAKNYFINQVPLSQELYNLSSFYLSIVLFIINITQRVLLPRKLALQLTIRPSRR